MGKRSFQRSKNKKLMERFFRPAARLHLSSKGEYYPGTQLQDPAVCDMQPSAVVSWRLRMECGEWTLLWLLHPATAELLKILGPR